jgi:putative PIN family toxin of toxin-antitoxin system
MRLAVFDTNVIVSAGLNRAGAPARLVYEWVLTEKVNLVTCPSVIAEFIEVTSRQKFARNNFPPDWLDYLIEMSVELPDPAPWPLEVPDKKDAVFLALAKSSGAWLVTGNLKHFPRSGRGGVAVISPGEYLEGLAANPP